MKVILSCLLAMLLQVMYGVCQTPEPKLPLNVGDYIPPAFELTNVYNQADTRIQLAGLRGKLVILDLWNSGCSSCIEAFPKMYEMQKEFGSRLQIILVNSSLRDSLQKVRQLIDKLKKRTGVNIEELPISLNQTSIMSYFSFISIPHYVWIDKDGKFIAATSTSAVTRANIEAALRGDSMKVRNKLESLTYDISKPLFVDGNGGNGNNFTYRTIFTGYIEGLRTYSGTDFNNEGLVTRCIQVNTSPRMLLLSGFPKLRKASPNLIIFEVRNPARFEMNWIGDTSFNVNSYETIIPPSTLEELCQHLQQEIPRLLGVKLSTEERLIKCLVISKGHRIEKIYSRGGDPKIDIEQYSLRKMLRNWPFHKFIFLLNSHKVFWNIPVIDETGITQQIDLDLPYNYLTMDLKAMKEFLLNQGFELAEQIRLMTVTVVKDK